MSTTSVEHDVIAGLERDEDGSRIVREELRLLGIVKLALETRAVRADTAGEQRRGDEARLLELRDEVAVAKPEDLPTLFEQMHHLGALRAQRGRGAQGFVDVRAPYFAHLRLVEDGKRRDVLIGARSYVDSSAGVRIVDWRHAPVSKIYYRYQEGEDYEEELGDRMVEGNVAARRSVAIAGGELLRVTSPQGVFVRRDGAWSRTTEQAGRLTVASRGDAVRSSSSSDKHLPEIAAMLDKAQFELITRPGTGLVAIQGSAGSGKTTVGLHRAAYLASVDPRRFKPEKMLVIVPSEALRHYVGRVLPSLGVEGVAIGTFARFARRIMPDLFPRLPYAISDSTPPVVSRAKSDVAMHKAMKAMQGRAMRAFAARVELAISKWPDSKPAAAAWAASSDIVVPDSRLHAFGQWLAGKRTFATTGTQPNTEARMMPDVTRSALDKVVSDNRVGARSVIQAWDELCTSREHLARTFEGNKDFGSGQLDQVHSWCVRQTRVRNEGERDGETATLDAEDHAMLLRLWQLLRGPLITPDSSGPLRFAHVFIDEVQDASPIELAILMDLADKNKSITLAGDAAQRMSDEGLDRGELDWNGLLDDLGVPHTTIEPLKVSYRSTAEITSFARAVLGKYAHEAEPIATRHGPPVELFEFTSPGEAVAFLSDALRTLAREAPDANVAIVSRFAQQADVYYEGLLRAEVPNVRRVAKQDFTWDAGFDVTDVRQTKGLEFDEVILVDTNAASYPDSAPARHALYVGATRAAHQLWCTTSEEPSPVVRAALANVPTR